MVFGIPGDSVTAIVIGVLYMKNLKPGPEIFEQQGTLVYSIYLIFVLANLVLLPVGWFAIKAGREVMRIPRRVLLPVILLFCIVGAYAVNGSSFDIALMLAFGLLGVVCERWKISIGALVLGLILGGPLEERFVQTLAGGQGSLGVFFDRPVAAALGVRLLAALVHRVDQRPSAGLWADRGRIEPVVGPHLQGGHRQIRCFAALRTSLGETRLRYRVIHDAIRSWSCCILALRLPGEHLIRSLQAKLLEHVGDRNLR